jgi:hypothetical protein
MTTSLNRKDPAGRMIARALYLHDGGPRLNAPDIASIMGKSAAHIGTVLKGIKSLRGKSPAKIADAIYKLYVAELGIEVPREEWNELWAKVQAGAAADVARLAGILDHIAKIADGRTWVLKLGRREIRRTCSAWHAEAGTV